MSFVKFMERVPSLHAVNDALGYVCLRWAAGGGEKTVSDVDRLEEENYRNAAGEGWELFFLNVF